MIGHVYFNRELSDDTSLLILTEDCVCVCVYFNKGLSDDMSLSILTFDDMCLYFNTCLCDDLFPIHRVDGWCDILIHV